MAAPWVTYVSVCEATVTVALLVSNRHRRLSKAGVPVVYSPAPRSSPTQGGAQTGR